MRFAFRAAWCLPVFLACGSAFAQIYVCKDAAGRTITSDRPVPECMDRVVRELDSAGRTRREIHPPPTAEEKRQLQLQEEKRKAEELAAEEQRRNDRLLRTRYQSEAELEAARAKAVDVVDEQLKRERQALAEAEKRQQKAQAETGALKKRNAIVPVALQQQLDEESQSVSNALSKIQEYEAEIALINAKYAAMLKRYRELAGESTGK
ncbi:MAG TPA: DUF4124 domain-containing protein [Noviherbaspirillum sp.]